jgi:hypothetical protein
MPNNQSFASLPSDLQLSVIQFLPHKEHGEYMFLFPELDPVRMKGSENEHDLDRLISMAKEQKPYITPLKQYSIRFLSLSAMKKYDYRFYRHANVIESLFVVQRTYNNETSSLCNLIDLCTNLKLLVLWYDHNFLNFAPSCRDAFFKKLSDRNISLIVIRESISITYTTDSNVHHETNKVLERFERHNVLYLVLGKQLYVSTEMEKYQSYNDIPFSFCSVQWMKQFLDWVNCDEFIETFIRTMVIQGFHFHGCYSDMIRLLLPQMKHIFLDQQTLYFLCRMSYSTVLHELLHKEDLSISIGPKAIEYLAEHHLYDYEVEVYQNNVSSVLDFICHNTHSIDFDPYVIWNKNKALTTAALKNGIPIYNIYETILCHDKSFHSHLLVYWNNWLGVHYGAEAIVDFLLLACEDTSCIATLFSNGCVAQKNSHWVQSMFMFKNRWAILFSKLVRKQFRFTIDLMKRCLGNCVSDFCSELFAQLETDAMLRYKVFGHKSNPAGSLKQFRENFASCVL